MKRYLLILPIVCWMVGCSSMTANSYRNLIGAPLRYASDFERHRELKQYRSLAREILAESGIQPSEDFAEGFEDGFAHFMEYGRPGGEPLIPPRKYWGDEYRTPAGHMAVEQWFTGFMEGVHVAARGSYRNVASLPLLVPCPQPTDLAFDAMIVSDGGDLSGEAIDVPDVSPAEEPPPAPPDELPPDHAEPLPSTDEQAGTVQLPEETSLRVYETFGVEIRQPEAILSDEPVLKEGMLFVR